MHRRLPFHGVVLTMLLSSQAFALDGGLCLDPGFARSGVFVLDVDGVDNVGFAPQNVAIQPDGKIVFGGAAAGTSAVVVRLDAAGALDPAFGTSGLARIDVGVSPVQVESVRVLGDGRIAIAGSGTRALADGGTEDRAFVARLASDGRIDSSFGGGVVLPSRALPGWVANGLVILPDGRSRIAGQGRGPGGDYGLFVAGLLADGGVDDSFGDAGLSLIDFQLSGDEFGAELVSDFANRLLLPCGTYSAAANFDFGLARLTSDGAYDPSFIDFSNRPGRVSTDFFGYDDSCNAVGSGPAGQPICVGSAGAVDGGTLLAAVKYLPAGALDPLFGAGGKLTLDVGGGSQGLRAIFVEPDGRFLAGGQAANRKGDDDFVVLSFNAQGGLEDRVADGGVLLLDIRGGQNDHLHGIVKDAQGRYVLSGDTSSPTGNDFALARLVACGALGSAPDAGGADAGIARGPLFLQVGCSCAQPPGGPGVLLALLSYALCSHLARRAAPR